MRRALDLELDGFEVGWRSLLLIFLAVCIYVGLSVASTGDIELFLGSGATIPFSNVRNVAFLLFYSAAPTLLALLASALWAYTAMGFRKVIGKTSSTMSHFSLTWELTRTDPHTRSARAILLSAVVVLEVVLPLFIELLVFLRLLPFRSRMLTLISSTLA